MNNAVRCEGCSTPHKCPECSPAEDTTWIGEFNHRVYCNADHRKPIGPNRGCVCWGLIREGENHREAERLRLYPPECSPKEAFYPTIEGVINAGIEGIRRVRNDEGAVQIFREAIEQYLANLQSLNPDTISSGRTLHMTFHQGYDEIEVVPWTMGGK